MVSFHTIVGNQRIITGQNGYYDGKVQDENVRYGRNAVHNLMLSNAKVQENHKKEMAETDELLKEIKDFKDGKATNHKTEITAVTDIPLDYKYTYSPNGKLNVQALLGSAYEELGAKSLPVANLTKAVQSSLTREDLKAKASAESMDLNQDGQIDTAEYATSLLTADMLSSNPDYISISPKDATGEISRMGIERSLPYFNKDTLSVARNLFKALYKHYNLGKEQENFFANPNNLVK